VGELPLALQSKLLRAIQQREVRPLGATEALPVDVRIVAATNRDLAEEVRESRFRADLFYRLRVVALELPPLRERPEDVPVLASHFLDRAARGSKVIGLEPEALERLIAHRWPGNVRELENTIEAATALAQGPRVTAADLQLGSFDAPAQSAGIALSLEAFERACLEEACGAVRATCAAAKLLGIGRSTFYRKARTQLAPGRARDHDDVGQREARGQRAAPLASGSPDSGRPQESRPAPHSPQERRSLELIDRDVAADLLTQQPRVVAGEMV
jgi:DNA-binding NtrC family response regulator